MISMSYAKCNVFVDVHERVNFKAKMRTVKQLLVISVGKTKWF